MSTAAPPRRRTRPLPLVVILVGGLLLLLGLVLAVSFGPAGRVQATTRVAEPGIALVTKEAVRSGTSPVTVSAAATSGKPLTLVRLLDDDARAAVDGSRHTTIDGVGFLPRSLSVTESGEGSLRRQLNADTFLERPLTSDRVQVELAPSQQPQTILLFPGAPGSARDEAIDVTLTWENGAWFWQSVAVAALGAVVLALGERLRRRAPAGSTPAPEPRRGDSAGTATTDTEERA